MDERGRGGEADRDDELGGVRHAVSPLCMVRREGNGRLARRAHRAEAAEEQVGDDRRHVGMAELAARLQPGEHPVHHAEQQHRQRLVELVRAQLRPGRGDRVGEGGDDLALAVEDAAAVGRRQEAHVFGQDAVLGLRAGIDREEGRDQAADPGLGLVRLGADLLDQRLEPGDVGGGDLEQQLLLVAEVVIERGLGDAAGLGHLVHRGGGVAAAGEQLRRAGEDLLALVVVASGASARHDRRRRLSARRTRGRRAR